MTRFISRTLLSINVAIYSIYTKTNIIFYGILKGGSSYYITKIYLNILNKVEYNFVIHFNYINNNLIICILF